MRAISAAALLAGLALATPALAQESGPVATTANGAVRGSEAGGVLSYKGIPYAQAPTGELRWRPPVAPEAWQGVRDATQFSADCLGAFPPGGKMSEDCLYLNVWTSAHHGAKPRPVMVWIYGGGYRGGSAAMTQFDGTDLARKGVVLVSFNYRTGSLGFLALPELARESSEGSAGNYGVLDAIAVLRWVKANIAAFGGDPNNVTIFGQSSGSETVNILTASPLAKGLFQKAIGESGSSFGVRAALPLAEAEKAGAAFMANRHASSLAELRRMPVDKLLELDSEKLEPNIDGWLLPDSVYAIYKRGQQNDVPMLIGSNGQEWGRPPEISPADFKAGVERDYGALAPKVTALLGPVANAHAATDARWKLTNAEWGDFPSSTWSSLQRSSGKSPVFRYLFDYAPPAPAGKPRTAHHGAELPYVFGTFRSEVPGTGPTDERVHTLMSGYWTNFARTGNPNGPGLPLWRSLAAKPGSYLRITGKGPMQEPARDRALIATIAERYLGRGSKDGK